MVEAQHVFFCLAESCSDRQRQLKKWFKTQTFNRDTKGQRYKMNKMITEGDMRHKKSKSGIEWLRVIAVGSAFFFFFKNNTLNKQVLVTLLELQLARIISCPCQAVGAFMRPGWHARTFPCGPTAGGLQEEGI